MKTVHTCTSCLGQRHCGFQVGVFVSVAFVLAVGRGRGVFLRFFAPVGKWEFGGFYPPPFFIYPFLYKQKTVALIFLGRGEREEFSEKEERKMRELEIKGGQAKWRITCLPFSHISSAPLSSHAHAHSLSLIPTKTYCHLNSLIFPTPHPFLLFLLLFLILINFLCMYSRGDIKILEIQYGMGR